ncbi:RmlC-like cupin [Auriculariales sp. MPI-PUGE-AT-0066]|nr:RmlC-like cupin [Auriculariales sp. MPI-PUGE-AT-0066]
MFTLRSLIVASVAFSATLAAPAEKTPVFGKRLVDDLSHQLVDEPTSLGRFNLLKGNVNNFVFDYIKAKNAATPGPDGTVVLADAGSYPMAIGNGVTMGVGWMGPCGLNVPHWHPRASELLVSVGGSLQFGTFQENGASLIVGTINDHQATIFPAGSLHYQQNLNCTAVQFYAAFNSEDPGRINTAPGFFQNLPAEIVDVTLGGLGDDDDDDDDKTAAPTSLRRRGVKEVQDIAAKIPKNVAFGVQSCLDRCNIDRAGQWTPEAVAKAKREFEEFMKQGTINPKDFMGLPVVQGQAA